MLTIFISSIKSHFYIKDSCYRNHSGSYRFNIGHGEAPTNHYNCFPTYEQRINIEIGCFLNSVYEKRLIIVQNSVSSKENILNKTSMDDDLKISLLAECIILQKNSKRTKCVIVFKKDAFK